MLLYNARKLTKERTWKYPAFKPWSQLPPKIANIPGRPSKAEFGQFVALMGGSNTHIHYASHSMPLPVWGNYPIRAWIRVANDDELTAEDIGRVARDRSVCVDQRCINPAHTKLLPVGTAKPKPAPAPAPPKGESLGVRMSKQAARAERNETRMKCFTRKITFDTLAEAEKAQAEVRNKPGRKVARRKIQHYKCNFCNLYHLTTHGK